MRAGRLPYFFFSTLRPSKMMCIIRTTQILVDIREGVRLFTKIWKIENTTEISKQVFVTSFRTDCGAHTFIPRMPPSFMILGNTFLKNYIRNHKTFLQNNCKYFTFKFAFECLNHPNLRPTYGKDNGRDKILFLSWGKKLEK